MARILIVDDEKQNRDSLTRALQDENPDWEIVSAGDEAEGIRLLSAAIESKKPIDVVLTDLVMETEHAGMSMISEARKRDPLVMAILFTAKEKNLDRYAAFDLGAFDVIEKNIRGVSSAREINVKTRAAIQYREWSRRIGFLRRYFDPKLFESIEKNPALLQPTDRLVTICFWDIRGFTAMCECLKAHPNLVADFLREYCELSSECILDHGGVLDKFIGDGVMAIFGVPASMEDGGKADAQSAIRAAISLRARFENLVERWTEEWALYSPEVISIGLGCGIHTGNALVGNMGTERRDQFTALGSTVNLAARIESRAKEAQILISQTTNQRLEKDRFPVSSAGEISDIKNIKGRFKLFSVDGAG